MTKIWENKLAMFAVLAVGVAGCGSDDGPVGPIDGPEGEAADAVRAFYGAFNAHSFEGAEDFAAEDWNLVDPYGRWTRGQAESVEAAEKDHSGTLGTVYIDLDDMVVSFASADVAVVTVTSESTGGGRTLGHMRSTFIVVSREGQWSLEHTQHTFIGEVANSVEGSVMDDLSDVGGDSTEDERSEGVRMAVAWFRDLQISNAFDDAADFAAEDLELIGPTGFWSRGREAAVGTREEVSTSFLDEVTFTPEESSVRFLTDDVAVVTETTALSRFTDMDGIDRKHLKLVTTSVVVNHDGAWLLKRVHNTIVESSL